jgi:hypothetical protein
MGRKRENFTYTIKIRLTEARLNFLKKLKNIDHTIFIIKNDLHHNQHNSIFFHSNNKKKFFFKFFLK